MRRYVHLACLLALACSEDPAEPVDASAAEHGRALFSDPRASTSASNRFSCATCHTAGESADGILPGASLAGVTTRRSFWGGARIDLLEAINDCRRSFMDARAPWTADDPDARAMWAFLESRAGTSPDPVPFTVVRELGTLPPGDPEKGRIAFGLACRRCHGTVHDGEGALASFVPRLPDDVDAAHRDLAAKERREVYVRKIRLGAFAHASGSMPPFSRETLSDDDVASILAYLGQ